MKHLLWQDDSLSISFGHLKDNQSGKNAIKKLPRNCYCNPLNHSCCVITGLFEYISTNPDIVSKPAEALFSGPLSAQAQRFGRFLSKILKKYESVINTKFGYDIKDIGTHSWRKGANTKLNCGSTGGPTAAAACIRSGHSMGTNRDLYIMGEAASDQVCGRLMAGLPIHLAEFAVSYVDFIDLDAQASLSGSTPQAEQQQRQAELDVKVDDALDSIFGKERLAANAQIRPILRYGLASLLYHNQRGAYDKLVKDSTLKVLPDFSPLRQSPVFSSPVIRELAQYATISMPWDGKRRYFKEASGLPPLVIMFAYQKQLMQSVESIPEKIEQILDRRQMMANMSVDDLAEHIANGPRFQGMSNDIRALRDSIASLNANGLRQARGGQPSASAMPGKNDMPSFFCTWELNSHQTKTIVSSVNTGTLLTARNVAYLPLGDSRASYHCRPCISIGTVEMT